MRLSMHTLAVVVVTTLYGVTPAVAADLEAGRYTIKAAHSGKCVDVDAAGLGDGINIQQYTCNGTTAQQFEVTSLGGGFYKLLNVNSGKAIDIVGGFTNDGANVQQWSDNGSGQQHFAIQSATGSDQFTIKNQKSGKCIDVADRSTADRANVQQWSCAGSTNQIFTFSRVGGTTSQACFYEDINYAGRSYCTGEGAADAPAGWMRLASSVKVPVGYQVDLFTDVGGSGRVLPLLADTATLVPLGFNDAMSSYRFSKANGTPPSSTAAKRQRMLDFLRDISGQQTLVGVENKNTGSPTSDTNRINAITGKVGSFWGADFGFAGAVGNRGNMVAEAKRQFAKGALVGLMYHACAPTQNEYCTWDDIGDKHPVHFTDDQFKELLTPGTGLNNAWLGRLDTLAGYFQQLKDAGVVVLFRPFHEMNMCKFWWSCHKGAFGSAALYRMTHDYLAKSKALDNIIWVWNVQDIKNPLFTTDIDQYNPGSDYFDIASLDIYELGYVTNSYSTMLRVADGKPIAIGENQFATTVDLLRQQPKWVYQMLWPDFIDDQRNRATLPSLYNGPMVLTLEEMPGWK